MPWDIVSGSGKCPEGKPFAVVKQADGELAGCHESHAAAMDQLAALYASETDTAVNELISTENNIKCTGDDCPELEDASPETPSQPLIGPPDDDTGDEPPPPPGDDDEDEDEDEDEDDNGNNGDNDEDEDDNGDDNDNDNDDEDFAKKKKKQLISYGMNVQNDEWSSVITFEGIESGDGRMFNNDALFWSDDPLPLMYQPSMLPGHDGAVLVGQIQDIKRDGNSIRARGVFDLGGPQSSLAHEAYRQVEAGILRGVSVDVDSVTDADIEYVYATDDPEDDAFWNPPTLMIVNKGRIRGATLTPMPAFAEARIELGNNLFMSETDSVVESTNLTTDLDLPDDVALSVSACVKEIEKLTSNLTYRQLPDEVRKSVYAHLRAHVFKPVMQINKIEPAKTLVAAAHVITVHDVPPSEWFNEPKDVQMHGALTVTDEGRVYGLLGPRYVNHRSFPGQNVQVPRGNVDYSLFMGGETIVSGGARVVTGVITMGCGHADTHPSLSSNDALEHYDNSCSVVANIRIGENAQGTWVAGAVTPGVTPDQIVKMMACRLSGDWRPHSQRSGMYEFCGALLVPVPGIPMARKQASVTVKEGVLVASSIPVELIRAKDAKTPVRASNAGIRMAAQVIARTVGRDLETRKEDIRRLIHGE